MNAPERGVPWFAIIIGTCLVGAVIVGVAKPWEERVPTEPEQADRYAPVDTPAPEEPQAVAPDAATPTWQVDAVWATDVAAATGIPRRAVVAYGSADLALASEQPECQLGWTTLAGIGWVETAHGYHDGSVLQESGTTEPRILGPRLDGSTTDVVADTDHGAWDGDIEWDRAVGPLQFIPSSWATWGADGNGDGVADPNQIDDASLAAARYLCASGPMANAEQWRAAVLSYNRVESYVDAVAAAANHYGMALSQRP